MMDSGHGTAAMMDRGSYWNLYDAKIFFSYWPLYDARIFFSSWPIYDARICSLIFPVFVHDTNFRGTWKNIICRALFSLHEYMFKVCLRRLFGRVCCSMWVTISYMHRTYQSSKYKIISGVGAAPSIYYIYIYVKKKKNPPPQNGQMCSPLFSRPSWSRYLPDKPK
jgi:hypothetical protein